MLQTGSLLHCVTIMRHYRGIKVPFILKGRREERTEEDRGERRGNKTVRDRVTGHDI